MPARPKNRSVTPQPHKLYPEKICYLYYMRIPHPCFWAFVVFVWGLSVVSGKPVQAQNSENPKLSPVLSDSLLLSLDSALAMASGNATKRAELHFKKANRLVNLGFFPAALKEISQADSLVTESENPFLVADLNSVMARIYQEIGDLTKALELYIKNHKLLENQHETDHSKTARNLIGIGEVYRALLEFENAFKYYQQALHHYTLGGDRFGLANCHNYFAMYLMSQKRYREAEENYRKGMEICRENLESSENILLGRLHGNLGLMYKREGRYDDAFAQLRLSLAIKEQNKDRQGLAHTLNELGEVHALEGQYDSAVYYGEMALPIITEIGNKILIRNFHSTLHRTYKAAGSFEKALMHHEASVEYADSVFNESKARETGRMETTLELQNQLARAEQVERENQLQEGIIRQQKQLNILAVSALALVLCFLVAMVIGQLKLKKAKRLIESQNQNLLALNSDLAAQEAKLETANLVLTQKNDQLEAAHEEQQMLMAVVAHDLKSPLNKVNGLAQVISLSGPVSEEQAHMLNLISDQAQKGGQLISDLLTAHQLDARNDIKKAGFDLAALTNQLGNDFKVLAGAKNIGLHVQAPDRLQAFANQDDLSRVLENLLSNAVKFTKPGKNVYLSLSAEGGKAKVTVRDEGPGISEADQKKLFRKFQRLENQPTGGESSTGLGLYIVKKLLEQNHGEIALESTLKSGSAFTVSIPLAKAGEASKNNVFASERL